MIGEARGGGYSVANVERRDGAESGEDVLKDESTSSLDDYFMKRRMR